MTLCQALLLPAEQNSLTCMMYEFSLKSPKMGIAKDTICMNRALVLCSDEDTRISTCR